MNTQNWYLYISKQLKTLQSLNKAAWQIILIAHFCNKLSLEWYIEGALPYTHYISIQSAIYINDCGFINIIRELF